MENSFVGIMLSVQVVLLQKNKEKVMYVKEHLEQVVVPLEVFFNQPKIIV